MNAFEAYQGKKVLVTGGLGFLGSNLSLRLAELGAETHAVDAMLPECGGNLHNLPAAGERIRISREDIRSREFMESAVSGTDIIFNLAGQVSHLGSMQDPQHDLAINCSAQLSLLEACRHANPRVKVVFASSRQLYGRPIALPVNETHPVEPVDINGIHKRAAERYHFIYGVYGLRATALRMTNTYGPRQLVRHNMQGFMGWFIRKAMDGEEITLFGDGSQLRDPVYVDDAVDAFLRAGISPVADGQLFNLGGTPLSLRAIAETLIAVCGSGVARLAPFPLDRQPIDIGSYFGDYWKAERLLGWKPVTPLEEGLRRTVEYLRRHREHYW